MCVLFEVAVVLVYRSCRKIWRHGTLGKHEVSEIDHLISEIYISHYFSLIQIINSQVTIIKSLAIILLYMTLVTVML